MMPDAKDQPRQDGVAVAAHHALGWLVVGNSVGLWLAILLVWPSLQAGEWTYGRWLPVHLNVQLYGWTSLPLAAWLFHLFEVNQSRAASWAPAAVWAWTTALAIGAIHWLTGHSSGKIFLDWKGPALWAFVAALSLLWLVLAVAWRDRSGSWNPGRRRLSMLGLVVLATVPAAIVYAASPAVYPPVDPTTGGPTGASLLGSTLVVISLMLLLPRVGATAGTGRAGWGTWTYLANCWLVFFTAEWIGGTHYQYHQIGAMLLLVPWVWLVPRDWAACCWPAGTRLWCMALLGWWALLVMTGVTMFFPNVLDHLKFTQGLVAHSHLAMTGFTTSFCGLLLVVLTGRSFAGWRSFMAWHVSALVMVGALAAMGWLEGNEWSWMTVPATWRTSGLLLRAACGTIILASSLSWLNQYSQSWTKENS